MKEMSDIFNSLYTGFLLRDFGGKVLPGAILAVVVLEGLLGSTKFIELIGKLPNPVWFISLAGCWSIGLAVQAIGVRIRLVRYSLKFSVKSGEFAEKVALFKSLVDDDGLSRQFERYMAIRETYGNNCAALILAILIWFFVSFMQNGMPENLPIIIILAIGLTYAMYVGHYETLKNMDEFWERTLDLYTNPEKIAKLRKARPKNMTK